MSRRQRVDTRTGYAGLLAARMPTTTSPLRVIPPTALAVSIGGGRASALERYENLAAVRDFVDRAWNAVDETVFEERLAADPG